MLAAALSLDALTWPLADSDVHPGSSTVSSPGSGALPFPFTWWSAQAAAHDENAAGAGATRAAPAAPPVGGLKAALLRFGTGVRAAVGGGARGAAPGADGGGEDDAARLRAPLLAAPADEEEGGRGAGGEGTAAPVQVRRGSGSLFETTGSLPHSLRAQCTASLALVAQVTAAPPPPPPPPAAPAASKLSLTRSGSLPLNPQAKLGRVPAFGSLRRTSLLSLAGGGAAAAAAAAPGAGGAESSWVARRCAA